MSMEEAIEQAEIIFDDGSMPSLTTTEQVPEVVTSVAVTPAPAPPPPATPPATVEPKPQPQQPPVTVTTTEQPQEHIEIEEEVVEIAVEEEVVTKEEEEPVQAQPEEEVATRHHNLRPKRTLRHVQALKQQAKRRKRNANVASTTAESPNATSQHHLAATATAVSPVMQKVCKKPTSTSMHNNGGKTKKNTVLKPLFDTLVATKVGQFANCNSVFALNFGSFLHFKRFLHDM